MSSSNFSQIFAQLRKTAEATAKSRGEYAAALWSVSSFLSDLPASHISYRDPKPLPDQNAYLLVEPAEESEGMKKSPGAAEKLEKHGGSWGLFIESAGNRHPAFRAPTALMVAAVRRLPDFLAGFSKELEAAAGSDFSLKQAKGIVAAIYEATSAR